MVASKAGRVGGVRGGVKPVVVVKPAFEPVDHGQGDVVEPVTDEQGSDVVKPVDHAHSDVGGVVDVNNAGQGGRDDEVIEQVDHVCSGVVGGVVVSNEAIQGEKGVVEPDDNGGGVIEQVDQVHSDVVIVKKNTALQGSKLVRQKPKLVKSLPEKRKESPCGMSNSVKKRSTPLASNKGRKSENKLIENQNLITKHFQTIRTAPGLGDGDSDEELDSGGGERQAVPRARANAGTGQSVGGKTVQTVTVVTIGQGQSAAGNLTNSGRGYCS